MKLMKLWIIDDSNKTAACVLEPMEVNALAVCVNFALLAKGELKDNKHIKNVALKLEKLGLNIEGL